MTEDIQLESQQKNQNGFLTFLSNKKGRKKNRRKNKADFVMPYNRDFKPEVITSDKEAIS